MRKTVLALAAAVLAFVPGGHGQGTKPEKMAPLMERKLQEAQKVLEGVAINDFDKIARHAEGLIVISKTAEWRAVKTPQYEVFSNEFQRTAGDLVKHAKEKNLDAAALSYVELTLTCVKCHKHVREVRMSRRD